MKHFMPEQRVDYFLSPPQKRSRKAAADGENFYLLQKSSFERTGLNLAGGNF
jgi:hypothetical protein